MTTILGIDVGSATVDAVWLEDGRVADFRVVDSGHDPQEVCARIVSGGGYDQIVATGYGRHAVTARFGGVSITEISAHAAGAREVFPETRSVLDIGGQDTKVMILSESGRLADFEMNDKCAAGTGRFLEVMAASLGFEVGEIGGAALEADCPAKVSAVCTVFAESEVIGLVHSGEDRRRIALGVHQAAIQRAIAVLRRLQAQPPRVFSGGCAKNVALVELLRRETGWQVLVPERPQLLGAMGAALRGA
jgi:predicted CoA-substrate-specific enzyme activase